MPTILVRQERPPPPYPLAAFGSVILIWLIIKSGIMPISLATDTSFVLLALLAIMIVWEGMIYFQANKRDDSSQREASLQPTSLLVALFFLFFLIRIRYPFLINDEANIDWLLAGLWAFMVCLVVADFDIHLDLPLLLIGLLGGLMIEAWGTITELWVYFSNEKPPFWILPAWPIAALTVERLCRLLRANRWHPHAQYFSWIFMIGFLGIMGWFVRPTWSMWSTQCVLFLLAVVTFVGAKPREDASLFIIGSCLGYFLEYWGTSRGTWVYWTGEIPPTAAVLAHGFASVAFARGLYYADIAQKWVNRGPVIGIDE